MSENIKAIALVPHEDDPLQLLDDFNLVENCVSLPCDNPKCEEENNRLCGRCGYYSCNPCWKCHGDEKMEVEGLLLLENDKPVPTGINKALVAMGTKANATHYSREEVFKYAERIAKAGIGTVCYMTTDFDWLTEI